MFTGHIPVIRQAASLTGRFFVLRAKQVLLSLIGVLPCDCAMTYYMLDEQPFLQRHTIHARLFLRPQAYVTDNTAVR
jgi:hypothetical protein